MSRVIAIKGIAPTLNTVGRIRASKPKPKSGKGAGKSSPFFRFTSQDREFIEQIGRAYGGEPYAWDEPKAPGSQWAVETEQRKIDVLIPPNPVYGPLFELWQGKGCERRCDSTQAEYQVDGANGPEMAYHPSCICRDELTGETEEGWLAAGAPLDQMPRACQMVMRVSVILPDLPMAGTWRIDTKSWMSAQKIPAMIQLIEQMQTPGLPAGYLYTQQSESFGGRRKYVEILLGVKNSPNEVAELAAGGGETRVAIGSGDAVLEAGTTAPPTPVNPDDEVVDGEVVDDETPVDLSGLPESLAAFKAWMGLQTPRMSQRAVVEVVTGVYPGTGEFESVNQIFENKKVLAWLINEYQAAL